ncbi:MAG TPA: T9SS type A sorting domain-containing protein [Bacteroidales bacterium]|nr:T9SS type A sorting domain-containing protein [Bacteroidales bacterium]HNS46173.1 T9SS type A sorting domain-containing protein [Bacteroidales bacterium]
MKKSVLTLVSLLFLLSLIHWAQGQQVISSGGNYSEAGGISVSWTLGEPVIATFSNDGLILTQGFQQPTMIIGGHLLTIPAGWSGISSWVSPTVPLAEDIFDPVENDLIVLLNPYGQVYWPAEGVNQIDPPPADEQGWVSHQGYIVKMEEEVLVLIGGLAENDLMVDLPSGWFILPVLAQTVVPSNNLFGQLDPNLVIAKEIAGNRIWWPAMGIHTLTNAEPGKSYQILLLASDVLDFAPFNAPVPIGPTHIELNQLTNVTPWNDVEFTGTSHTIAISGDAWGTIEGLSYGDYMGAFTPNGLCSGMMVYTGKGEALSITAFGDDPTTPSSIEGFLSDEPMHFRLYRPSANEEFQLSASFDPSLPHTDIYQVNGLSGIVGLTLMATSITETGFSDVEIYPNPAGDLVMIKCIGNISRDARLSVYAIGSGQLVMETRIEDNLTELDIQELAQGIYFVRITDGHEIIIKKLVKQSNRFNY